MKTQSTISEVGDLFVPTSLYHLVERLSDGLATVARRNKNFIINNVPEDICSQVNESTVVSVLTRLMNAVIEHTENSCIRLSAKVYGNVILLHVKDDGCLNYDSIAQHLSDIQAQAEQIGGFVGFTSYRNRLTTIAFSFTNIKISGN